MPAAQPATPACARKRRNPHKTARQRHKGGKIPAAKPLTPEQPPENTPIQKISHLHEISGLARSALDDGAQADSRMLKALAIAKVNYVASVFDICSQAGCRAFASIVETDAQPTTAGGLRKDYAYLFERFFYFLEDNAPGEQGIVVFDELEESKSHLLIDQMHRYFADTAVGRHRADRIIPEPFFVHSDLTTGVQIADLVAYIISWGFRMARMTKPARAELSDLANQVARLRYRAVRDRLGNPQFEIWSFAHITDLRTQAERDDGLP